MTQPRRIPDPVARVNGARGDGLDARLDPSSPPDASSLFACGGEMGALMSHVDWASTPLGPVSGWSHALRATVGLLLRNRFPLLLWWGPKFVQIYNDAYMPIPGAKHPRALGQPGAECWTEIWNIIGPMAEAPFRGEAATWSDDLPLLIHRKGFIEETHFKVAYSPVPDESTASGVGGVLAIVAEITGEVYARRQLATLRDLAGHVSDAKTAEQACEMAARTIQANSMDIPCALFYLVDAEGGAARLVAAAGFPGAHSGDAPPASFALDDEAPGWPVGRVMRERRAAVVHLAGTTLPRGAWKHSPSRAVILPLAAPEQPNAYGAVVFAASPHRELDDQYEAFFDLAAEHVASAIRNARAYQRERERAEKLAELDRAKTLFFSNVSHEFRTPLTLMLAPIEEMRSERGAADGLEGRLEGRDGRERLDLLHRNAQRLLKLVNTLLDFSRIEAGRVEASYEPTDLSALTADLASSFRSTIESAGLTLVTDLPPLPEEIYVDHDMWEKIVLNLLSNAFKFTFEGTITVSLRAADRAAELEVADTGIGVAEAELPRLFERFHRIEGARSRSHEGSGIGLALVQELVRLHGGEIRVRSRPGQGTAFVVRVPRGRGHLPKDRLRAPRELPSTALGAGAYVEEALGWVSTRAAGAVPCAPPVAARAPNERRARIVFADDNADMRNYVSRLLREHWDVEAVADGETALRAIRSHPPDLVLTDVMMPGLDGFALLRALRGDAATRDTPVILLSARAGEEATAEGLNAGADDYLVKPFTARDLFVRITARLAAVKAARETREQRAQLYRAFMRAPVPVAILRGPDQVIDLANDACLKAWGKRSDIIGLPLLEAMPEVRDQPFPGLLETAYRTGNTHEGRSELTRLPTGPGGALRDHYFNHVFAPIWDARGNVEAVMACGFDITEQVAGRQELLVTAQRLQAAQSVAGIGLFDWDLRRERVYWSPELYVLMGLEPGAVAPTATAWNDALVDEDRDLLEAAFREATAAGRGRLELELRLRQPHGSARWVRLTTEHHYDRAGVCRVIGAVVDVQALKEAAAVRTRALEEAERTSRAKDEFLATMSHELRTPLNAMLGWATMLKRDRRDEARLERGLAIIERNAQTQARLVSDLLDVSRIISGKLRLSMNRLYPSTVIHAAADVIRPAAEAKGVRLVVDLDPELGATVGDPDRLQQIVWNLLSNAVRFTPAKGRVTVSASREGSMVILRVQDTGTGIPREHLPHIFERFRQVDSSTTRAHGGLGLGLAIVRHLVEAHGGTVAASSEGPGLGSTFTVTLPITAVAARQFEEAAAAADGGGEVESTERVACRGPEELPLREIRALVVEDDDDSLELIRVVLEEAGARVVGVSSAHAALEERHAFDVIVSDLGMPEMDGCALMRRLRAQPSTAAVPAIALTAYARFEDAERALAAGYQQHVAKPVEPTELIATVQRVVRGASPGRA